MKAIFVSHLYDDGLKFNDLHVGSDSEITRLILSLKNLNKIELNCHVSYRVMRINDVKVHFDDFDFKDFGINQNVGKNGNSPS